MKTHLGFLLGLTVVCGLHSSASAQITLSAGDVALIGWVDNGSPQDIYTFVNLADLPAGATFYITDNGWTGTSYRNTLGVGDGDGNEQLSMFTANVLIPAGRIISTTDSSTDFSWTFAGSIPGASGSFAVSALAQAGDQLYVFQHDTGTNPLNTALQEHIFVLDDTGAFEPATSAQQGDVPPGLSVTANTAVTFAQNGSGQNFMGFNTATLASGTKSEWLAAIGNAANWTFGGSGTLPSGTIVVGLGGVGTSFCFGDGTGTACPCGNTGATENGCGNSAFASGAHLAGSGVASVAADSLVITATDVPGPGLFFQGTGQFSGGAGITFGDGLLCAGGAILRLGVVFPTAAAAAYPGGLTPNPIHMGGATAAGDVRHYQCWYRDAAVFCSSDTYNLTQGLTITWAP